MPTLKPALLLSPIPTQILLLLKPKLLFNPPLKPLLDPSLSLELDLEQELPLIPAPTPRSAVTESPIPLNNAKEDFAAPSNADMSEEENPAEFVCPVPPRPASERLAAIKLENASLPPSRVTPARSAKRLEEEKENATSPLVSANKRFILSLFHPLPPFIFFFLSVSSLCDKFGRLSFF